MLLYLLLAVYIHCSTLTFRTSRRDWSRACHVLEWFQSHPSSMVTLHVRSLRGVHRGMFAYSDYLAYYLFVLFIYLFHIQIHRALAIGIYIMRIHDGIKVSNVALTDIAVATVYSD